MLRDVRLSRFAHDRTRRDRTPRKALHEIGGATGTYLRYWRGARPILSRFVSSRLRQAMLDGVGWQGRLAVRREVDRWVRFSTLSRRSVFFDVGASGGDSRSRRSGLGTQ